MEYIRIPNRCGWFADRCGHTRVGPGRKMMHVCSKRFRAKCVFSTDPETIADMTHASDCQMSVHVISPLPTAGSNVEISGATKVLNDESIILRESKRTLALPIANHLMYSFSGVLFVSTKATVKGCFVCADQSTPLYL